MKKRAISLILTLCLIMGMVPSTVFAAEVVASGTCGENLTWVLTDNGTLTISGEGAMNIDYEFDDSGYSYAPPWNNWKSSIKTVHIESGVTTIGAEAFCNCRNLTSISIPDSVVNIGTFAFGVCCGLTNITIPKSVTIIENDAFRNCEELICVSLSDNLKIIGSYAFLNCFRLSSLTIPNSVTSIESWAFTNCSSLTCITIPESVTQIGYGAFSGCYGLERIIFCGNAPDIEWEVFDDVTATVYYPSDNATWTSDVMQNYSGTITWLPYDSSNTDSTNSAFNQYIYQADHLRSDRPNTPSNLDYYMEYVKQGSPALNILESGEVESAAEAWRNVTMFLDTLESGSKPIDYTFDQVDAYESILLNALECASTSDSLMSEMANIFGTSADLLENIEYILKTEYGWDVVENFKMADATDAQLKELEKAFGTTIQLEKYSELAKPMQKLMGNLKGIMKTAGTIGNFIEKMTNYACLAQVSDSMTIVLNEMLEYTPSDNWAMRDAIIFCSKMVSETDSFIFYSDALYRGSLNTAGKYALETCVSEFWKVLRDKAITKVPELGLLLVSYKASSTIMNVLGNSEDISEQTFKLTIVRDYYNVINQAILAREEYYNESRTVENAMAILDGLDLLFSMAYVDHDQSYKYVDVVEEALLNKLFGGDDTVQAKSGISYKKKLTQEMEERANLDWITYLKEDYPNEYWDYAHLIGDEKPLVVNLTRSYTIECPVNVYVYDAEGNLVAYAIDGRTYASGEIGISQIEDRKYINIYDDSEYRIICDGYDAGTMDIEIQEYDENSVVRKANFYDLAVTNDSVHEMETKEDVTDDTAYSLKAENKTIISDYDSADTTANKLVVLTLENGIIDTEDGPIFQIEAHPNDKIDVQAIIPKGYQFVCWEVDSGTDMYRINADEIFAIRVPDQDAKISAVIEKIPTIRIYGSTRYDTAFEAADQLKENLGIEKFENIVVAYGEDFADALSGSYLANQKNAPILLVKNRNKEINLVKDYIKANLTSGGTVYLLGGVNAVPKAMESGLEGFNVKRLAGATRYETNLEILKEAGISGNDILVCTGKDFADGLSASAVNKPILLVKDSLRTTQVNYLKTLGTKNFYLIGGTNAVNKRIESALSTYGTTQRIEGATRYYTSVNIAKTFFPDAKAAVLAYAQNFPDGLSGGCLACSMNAPLILTANGKQAPAVAYAKEAGITGGAVLGGTGLIPDKVANAIFQIS